MTSIFDYPHVSVEVLDTIRNAIKCSDTEFIRIVRVYNKKEEIPKEIIVDQNILSCDIQTIKDNPFFFGPIFFKEEATIEYFKSINISMLLIYGEDTELATPLINRMTNIKLSKSEV